MLKTHKNILLTIIGLIILFFGYWYIVLSKKTSTSSSSNLSVAVNSQNAQPTKNVYDKEFLSNLQNIKDINLNTDIIYKNLAYKALNFPEKPFEVDYDIPSGRNNPFLPIGVNAGAEVNSVIDQAQDELDTPSAATTTTNTTEVKPQPQQKPQPKQR